MAPMLVLLAFVFGVGLVMAIYLGATKLPGMMMQKKLEGRLQELTQPLEDKGEA